MSMMGPPVTRLDCSLGGPSRTKQSMLKECNINWIVEKFAKTGLLAWQNKAQPVFEDVSEIGDYRAAIEKIDAARESFMELPAKVRARFENDAVAFLDFMSDEANRAEAIELGLVKKPDEAAPPVAAPAPPVVP